MVQQNDELIALFEGYGEPRVSFVEVKSGDVSR